MERACIKLLVKRAQQLAAPSSASCCKPIPRCTRPCTYPYPNASPHATSSPAHSAAVRLRGTPVARADCPVAAAAAAVQPPLMPGCTVCCSSGGGQERQGTRVNQRHKANSSSASMARPNKEQAGAHQPATKWSMWQCSPHTAAAVPSFFPIQQARKQANMPAALTPFSSTSAASLTCVKRAAACGDLSMSGWHTRAARRNAAFTSSLWGWKYGT